MLQVILRSFCVFPIFNNLVSRKWQLLEWNIYLNLYIIQFYVVIVWHLEKQIVKAPGLLVFSAFAWELFVTSPPYSSEINTNSKCEYLCVMFWDTSPIPMCYRKLRKFIKIQKLKILSIFIESDKTIWLTGRCEIWWWSVQRDPGNVT